MGSDWPSEQQPGQLDVGSQSCAAAHTHTPAPTPATERGEYTGTRMTWMLWRAHASRSTCKYVGGQERWVAGWGAASHQQLGPAVQERCGSIAYLVEAGTTKANELDSALLQLLAY